MVGARPCVSPPDAGRAGAPWHAVRRCPLCGPDPDRRRPASSSNAMPASATPRRRSSCRGSQARSVRCSWPPREVRSPRRPRRWASPVRCCRHCPAPRSGSSSPPPATPRILVAATPSLGLEEAQHDGALVFHAGVRRDSDGTLRTSGGRVLAVVGRGTTLGEAADTADQAAERITFHGVQRRHDIGRGGSATSGCRLRSQAAGRGRPMTRPGR